MADSTRPVVAKNIIENLSSVTAKNKNENLAYIFKNPKF
jgi:hypothetical protein